MKKIKFIEKPLNVKEMLNIKGGVSSCGTLNGNCTDYTDDCYNFTGNCTNYSGDCHYFTSPIQERR